MLLNAASYNNTDKTAKLHMHLKYC